METYDKLLIKMDLLSVEAMDKIQITIELLQQYGYIDNTLNLREAYEQAIGVYNLKRNEAAMWKMIYDHKIISLFQMEQQSGIQGIDLVHPSSVDELAVLNSIIRLMPSNKKAERPLEKFARFKNDIRLWYNEMREWGLTEEEMKILEPVAKISYGITESQESQ